MAGAKKTAARRGRPYTRKSAQKGGAETEGATFMDPRFFQEMGASSNAETVTSGNGSYPPMGKHNLITGIPMKAAPGASVVEMAGGKKRGRGRPRKSAQKGGAETEGATFMDPRFFQQMAASSNAETVTSGNGSYPALGKHNLMTGIPIKAAPGASVVEMAGGKKRGRRNQKGGDNLREQTVNLFQQHLDKMNTNEVQSVYDELKTLDLNTNMSVNEVDVMNINGGGKRKQSGRGVMNAFRLAGNARKLTGEAREALQEVKGQAGEVLGEAKGAMGQIKGLASNVAQTGRTGLSTLRNKLKTQTAGRY